MVQIRTSSKEIGEVELWCCEVKTAKIQKSDSFFSNPQHHQIGIKSSGGKLEPRLVHLLFLTGMFFGSEVSIAFQKWRRKGVIICAFPMVKKKRVLGN